MTETMAMKDTRHRQHIEWLHRLDFTQDQIGIYQTELSRVLQQQEGNLSIIEHVEEYREILLRKLHHIDELRAQIQVQERQLSGLYLPERLAEEWPVAQLDQHINGFLSDFDTLRNTMRRFVSRHD
jgi:Asp-tRNA(Asn)/Glu-tRNA(Gln) amidotransferase C subunit